MDKPTPGPWKISEPKKDWNGEYSLFEIHWSDAGECIAEFVHGEPDARLIAAAPDLLDAARRALNFIENTEDEFGDNLPSGDALRAAIARATGEA